MKNCSLLISAITFFFLSCTNSGKVSNTSTLIADTLKYPEEIHFKNVQQLTFGGDNAEAYFSFDGKSIIFQRTK
jgi:hypothetical protein